MEGDETGLAELIILYQGICSSHSIGGLDPLIQSLQPALMPQGFVYLLASKCHGTLYCGVTNNLAA
jgi:hypothetical protein